MLNQQALNPHHMIIDDRVILLGINTSLKSYLGLKITSVDMINPKTFKT